MTDIAEVRAALRKAQADNRPRYIERYINEALTALSRIEQAEAVIEARTLERAAKLFEEDADEENDNNYLSRREITASLRALKEQP